MGKKDYPDSWERGYDRGKRGLSDGNIFDDLFDGEDQAAARREGHYEGVKDRAKYEHMAEKLNSEDDDSSGGCFLTMACCENKGLPDDCYELEVLRDFRDNYMMSEHYEEVTRYYEQAPGIVAAVNRLPNAKFIWNETYDKIVIAVDMIERGEQEKAFELYKSLFGDLRALSTASGSEVSAMEMINIRCKSVA